jgi:hypothetical protein
MSQELETIERDEITEESNDSLAKYKDKFGLRVGLDLYNSLKTAFDEDFKGFEIVGDFRLTNRIFLAAEIGAIEKFGEEDHLDYTAKGAYAKIGTNYNLYENWGDMHNEIYIGIRYGFSTYSQILNSYTPNYFGTYFDLPTYTPNIEADGLTAHWGEFVIGLKVELFNNLFAGASIAMKKMLSQDEPDQFQNFYVPGFERVYLNKTGFSFNYTLSYSIPIYKKNR